MAETMIIDTTNVRAHAIRSIMESGADRLQNFFDVAFLFRDKGDREQDGNPWSTLLLTRVGSIDIPRLKAKTFSLKTIRGSVEKVRSNLDGSYATSVSIRADQDVFILDKMAEVAGVWEFSGTPVIFPASSINTEMIPTARMDVAVYERGQDAGEVDGRTGLWTAGKPVGEWVLEDARIVGISDQKLEFSATSPLEISINLICRRVSHRDLTTETA